MIERLILGCAHWGARISQSVAMDLLDLFVESGGRQIDTAPNYPINGNMADFGLANRIIAKWLKANPSIELNVFVKIGSVNNLGGPECVLTYKKLNADVRSISNIFENSLGGVGIHWDNRGEQSNEEIIETTDFMRTLFQQNFRIGFSGLKNKATYLNSAPDLANFWEIQVKETISKMDLRMEYLRLYPKAKYIAYGVGSEKHTSNQDYPPQGDLEVSNLKSDYYYVVEELLVKRKIDKVLIGPRTLSQLDQVIRLSRKLE